MSATLVAALLPLARRAGADLVGRVLGDRFGRAGEELTGAVIDEVARRAGVLPEELPQVPESQLEIAIADTEAMMPEMLALWSKGLDGQFALAQAEVSAGGFNAAWRPGWMYLLGLMWFVRLMVMPVADQVAGTNISAEVDMGIMMTLTSWFIGLYMGGHTLKTLGQAGVEAVRAARSGGNRS